MAQEIDALTTMGISALEFLVLALVLMMPLLCLFADLVGMFGGLFVGVTMLDLSASSYLIGLKEQATSSYINFTRADPAERERLLLAHSKGPRVRGFLTRGQKGGESVGSHG